MTSNALVAAHRWSAQMSTAGMLDLAAAAHTEVDGRTVRAIAEQLVCADPGGRRWQAVRLDMAGLGDDLTLSPDDVRMRTAGGTDLPVRGADGPAGALRLLIPAVTEPTTVRVCIESLSAEDELDLVLTPVREWTIHLIHHSHLDIGYTDPQPVVLGEHIAFLDSCLDLVRATADRPDDAQFRWVVEALWSFEQWAAARPPATVAEFVRHVRAGRIELTALPYNMHSDTCSTDELHELLRPAHRVRQRYGVPITAAMQTDVPGTVAGLPDALAQAGVRYLSVAHNWAGRSVPHLGEGRHLPRLFRWRSPAGASVLVWMTDSPHGAAYMEGNAVGFGDSYADVDALLPAYLTALGNRPYPYPPGGFGWHGAAVTDRAPYQGDVLHLRVQGLFGDNAPPRLVVADTVARWNQTWLYPRLRMSSNQDFFADAEQRAAGTIPEFEGDWGDWWVEGIGSGARPLAMTRTAQAGVVGAQTLAGMSRLLGGPPLPGQVQRNTRTYGAISMFNEHTWGAADSWDDADSGPRSGEQQWHWKYSKAIDADEAARGYTDHAAAHLGAVLPTTPQADVTFWAANTTAVARSSTVRLFLRESRVPLDQPVQVRDGRTGAALPTVSIAQHNPTHRDAGRFLDVAVPDLPALGLVRLDVTATDRQDPPPTEAPADPVVMQNDHLRVRVDLARAAISSIVDLATGLELVDDTATVGFNGYVYDTYTTAGGYNHLSNKMAVSPELELLGSRTLARPAALIERVTDEVAQRLVYEYAADGVRWIRTTLRLEHDAARLDIDNRMSKPTTMTKESAFFAFPFATR